MILTEKDIFEYLDISSESNIYYNPLYQFIVKSVDYLYEEEYIYIYVNLLNSNEIKNKSNSVGVYKGNF